MNFISEKKNMGTNLDAFYAKEKMMDAQILTSGQGNI